MSMRQKRILACLALLFVPVIPTDAEVLLETAKMSIRIDDTGSIRSLLDRGSGADYVVPRQPAPLLSLRVAGRLQAPEAMHQLSRLPWPGNVAQLRRVLTETVARQRSGVISADMLPPECRSVTRRKLSQMEALERDAIVRSLRDNGGNKQDAARTLGMSRATIYRKINDYGIA